VQGQLWTYLRCYKFLLMHTNIWLCHQTYDLSYHDITFCDTAVLATPMWCYSLANNILLSPFTGLQWRNNSRAAQMSPCSATQCTLRSHRPTSTNSSFINQKNAQYMMLPLFSSLLSSYTFRCASIIITLSFPLSAQCLDTTATTQGLQVRLFAWTLPTWA
jgi:hypothetical protein